MVFNNNENVLVAHTESVECFEIILSGNKYCVKLGVFLSNPSPLFIVV